MRATVRRLRRELGEDADNPTYIFAEPRIGYWMPKGEDGGRRNCMSEERHTSEDIEDGGTE